MGFSVNRVRMNAAACLLTAFSIACAGSTSHAVATTSAGTRGPLRLLSRHHLPIRLDSIGFRIGLVANSHGAAYIEGWHDGNSVRGVWNDGREVFVRAPDNDRVVCLGAAPRGPFYVTFSSGRNARIDVSNRLSPMPKTDRAIACTTVRDAFVLLTGTGILTVLPHGIKQAFIGCPPAYGFAFAPRRPSPLLLCMAGGPRLEHNVVFTPSNTSTAGERDGIVAVTAGVGGSSVDLFDRGGRLLRSADVPNADVVAGIAPSVDGFFVLAGIAHTSTRALIVVRKAGAPEWVRAVSYSAQVASDSQSSLYLEEEGSIRHYRVEAASDGWAARQGAGRLKIGNAVAAAHP